MAERPRNPQRRRQNAWPWLIAILCTPIVFWVLLAWEGPREPNNPLWFVGGWTAPEGKLGNRLVFEPPTRDAANAKVAAGARGAALAANFPAEGVTRLTWTVVSDNPLILQIEGGQSVGIPGYARLLRIDDHNMQIRFANDASVVRQPGFLSGGTATILVRQR